MEEALHEFAHTIFSIVKVIVIVLVECVKACLPNGVLPRKSVRGDVCLVTGAGSGIGRLMAIQFAKLGCTLVLWDINTKGNEETKKLIATTGAKVKAYTVDLSKREELKAVADKVIKELGRVDILINNAGVVTGHKLFDCPDEMIEKTMAVNCNANLFTAKCFLPGMLERRHGHIVTISSIAGKAGAAGMVDYCASKHGAVGYHEALASELHHQCLPVKTTLVCPYFIDTGMFRGFGIKSPLLMPPLQPSYVAECVVEAVLTNRAELQLPRSMYLVSSLARILPTEAKHCLADYFGTNESMETFVGRSEKKP